MLIKTVLASSICLFASNIYAQQPSCQTPQPSDPLSLATECISVTPVLREALLDLTLYLRTTKPTQLIDPDYPNTLDIEELQNTANQLLQWLDNPNHAHLPLTQVFTLQPLGEANAKRPVQLGGYFTSLLDVTHTPNPEFRYPIYNKPQESLLPSRRDIMQGALAGKGLEIAWTNDPVAYYFMQVQGSGLIRYPDGYTELLGFAGKNAYPYASIGRYMQEKGYLRTDNLSNVAVSQWLKLNPDKRDEVLNANQSFVFFQPIKDVLRSASGLPVIAGHTASVDNRVIPLGSILLAELPLRDNNGKIVQHEWRLLLATDRRSDDRGAIKIGIYTGEGEAANAEAQRFFPAGRAFVLHGER